MAILDTDVREVRLEHAWIPLSDGCRLSAKIWLPADAEDDPVPAVLEYIPYRKDDGTAVRDLKRHPYFASCGYAAVRVDLRGSGDSQGILYDEYLQQEHDDGLEVLTWLAAQPWCTGAAGIMGISWGGFNALQIAARRPPELKAIIALCATDDRYADDVHYMGGCVHESMLGWASSMLAYNARPPDPTIVGDGWRELWLDRLERTPPYIEAWLTHQRRDDFWRHGSVCEDFGAIECPVYIQSGWADWYRNPVATLLAGLSVPRKGLIGPWAHVYPDDGRPGPAIDFARECVRWWDHWLKGIDTGIMDEPMLTTWMPDPVEATAEGAVRWLRAGRWVSEPSWPSPNVETRELYLAAHGLDGEEPAEEIALEITGVQSAGVGASSATLVDQRADDARWLCFDSAPLEDEVTVLGLPYVELALAGDRANGLVAVRLCDLAPSGVSTLVTRGQLNLTHREDHAEPSPLSPGKRYGVRIRFDMIAHVFRPGHRLRIAVSPTSWPSAWPSPEPVTLSVFAGPASRLELPVRRPLSEEPELQPFEPPQRVSPTAQVLVRPSGESVERDFRTGKVTFRTRRMDRDGVRFDDGLVFQPSAFDEHVIVDGKPLSARVQCERSFVIERGDWRTRVETTSTMSSDARSFHVTNVLEAYEDDVRLFVKNWLFSVPRDLV
ncbi:MAG: CocE/NonD family hydrolase [Actinobacteria bacterium]|nr:MAG: CocE/NonD family hydrolase [Actinomycetota bacterium]